MQVGAATARGGAPLSPPGMGMRKRILVLLIAFGLAVLGLGLRLAFLQVWRAESLRQGAVDVRTRMVPVQARRGVITDRNGEVLVDNVDVYSVYANPSVVQDKAGTAARLAAILQLPADRLLSRLNQRTLFVWLQRRTTDAAAAAIRAAQLPGIHLTRESQRAYPEGTLAAQVLGFAGIDSQGLAGVELQYDAQLRGTPGQILVEYDARNHPIPRGTHQYVPPLDGLGLRLTLDARLQFAAERELAKAVAEHGALGGSVLVMDPNTGEILAMANLPTFDPSDPGSADPSAWRNRIVSDTISPGSVFKPITAAAGLQDGLVTPDSGFYDPGFVRVGGWTIHNFNGRGLGSTTFARGFAQSANVVFAQLGLRVGAERFYRFLNAFGLLSRTGIDLPGEARGIIPPLARVKPIDLAVMSFGQTLTVTPIAMATAIAAIANGGKLMWPHVAKDFVGPNGQVVQAIQPRVLGEPISPATAAVERRLMMGVVAEGTGTRAQIPGYDIAGKTGTTNKVVGGRVSRSNYIGSFIGFFPAEHPRVLIYVMIDEPQGIPYGGFVAAPVFNALAQDAIRILDIPPDHPDQVRGAGTGGGPSEVKVPSLVNLTVAEARVAALSAGLNFAVRGSGEGRVREQVPPPGTSVATGSTVVVFTAPRLPAPAEEGTLVTVPNLRGMNLRQAAAALAQLGLVMDGQGSGNAVEQDPPPGTSVPPGTVVHVTFR
jgi:stage V sporulation protein D (sporulation-specific penicillin-binding protein)